jgi:hypothetical protein
VPELSDLLTWRDGTHTVTDHSRSACSGGVDYNVSAAATARHVTCP